MNDQSWEYNLGRQTRNFGGALADAGKFVGEGLYRTYGEDADYLLQPFDEAEKSIARFASGISGVDEEAKKDVGETFKSAWEKDIKPKIEKPKASSPELPSSGQWWQFESRSAPTPTPTPTIPPTPKALPNRPPIYQSEDGTYTNIGRGTVSYPGGKDDEAYRRYRENLYGPEQVAREDASIAHFRALAKDPFAAERAQMEREIELARERGKMALDLEKEKSGLRVGEKERQQKATDDMIDAATEMSIEQLRQTPEYQNAPAWGREAAEKLERELGEKRKLQARQIDITRKFPGSNYEAF